MDASKFQEEAGKFGLTAEADGEHVVLSHGDKKLLRIEQGDGHHRFRSLVDQPETGVVAGQALVPSDQENLAAHAATCAHDLVKFKPPGPPSAAPAKAEAEPAPAV